MYVGERRFVWEKREVAGREFTREREYVGVVAGEVVIGDVGWVSFDWIEVEGGTMERN